TDLTTGQTGIRIDNGSALAVMRGAAAHGGMVMAHAEDDELIKYMAAKLAREGRDRLENVHLVRGEDGRDVDPDDPGRARRHRDAGNHWLLRGLPERTADARALRRGVRGEPGAGRRR